MAGAFKGEVLKAGAEASNALSESRKRVLGPFGDARDRLAESKRELIRMVLFVPEGAAQPRCARRVALEMTRVVSQRNREAVRQALHVCQGRPFAQGR